MKLKFEGNWNNMHECSVAKFWNVERSLDITYEEVQPQMFPWISPIFYLNFQKKDAAYAWTFTVYGIQKSHL